MLHLSTELLRSESVCCHAHKPGLDGVSLGNSFQTGSSEQDLNTVFSGKVGGKIKILRFSFRL